MMQAVISPGQIKGTLRVPASKSYSQRALALSLLHHGITQITGVGKSDDEEAARQIIKEAGASVRYIDDDTIQVNSSGKPSPHGIINCGESALCLRMFAPVLALGLHAFEMHGRGTLLSRPLTEFQEFFPVLGVHVDTAGGYLPVKIRGPLKPKDIIINGSESSQYLTGLLMAFSAACSEPATIQVKYPVSKPYTDLTLQLLEKFSCKIKRDGYSSYTILPTDHSGAIVNCRVEGDWSQAAFWLVAGAMAGDISIRGLSMDSCQGDKLVVDVLRKAGVNLQLSNDNILVEKCLKLKGFELDATDHPDLFPPLAVLAAAAKGRSVIGGVSRLRNKESDRADLILRMLSTFGISATVENDNLLIEGGLIKGGIVDSGHDHRIVMAASIAGLVAASSVTVRHASSVSKSYPVFFEDLRSLGAVVSLNPEIFLA